MLLLVLSLLNVPHAGDVVEVRYPPSDKPGELIYGVTYRAWIPPGVKTLRGLIVHQHGCGAGACKGGQTAADDLHWQALAQKWGCALVGPSFEQEDKQDCRKWCDPRNGSGKVFLKALADIARKSEHPEFDRVPWCLWGHSGGGFWASLMQPEHADRIVAIWFRSGTAFASWEKKEIAQPNLVPAVFTVPIALNPGQKEKDDKRFSGAWTGSEAMFKHYRAKGAPALFCPDPRSAHECGDCRYMAIPFFDACLKLRLPESGTVLKPVANPGTEGNWYPSDDCAQKIKAYQTDNMVVDTTPPPEPESPGVSAAGTGVKLTWKAAADFESGLAGFVVLRDGKEWKRLPEKPNARFGRPLFQGMSYHDTPEAPLAAMSIIDSSPAGSYAVLSVNTAGLKSKPVPFPMPRR